MNNKILTEIIIIAFIEGYILYKLRIKNKKRIKDSLLDYLDVTILYSLYLSEAYKKGAYENLIEMFNLASVNNAEKEFNYLLNKIVNKRKRYYSRTFITEKGSKKDKIRLTVKNMMQKFINMQLEFRNMMKTMKSLEGFNLYDNSFKMLEY